MQGSQQAPACGEKRRETVSVSRPGEQDKGLSCSRRSERPSLGRGCGAAFEGQGGSRSWRRGQSFLGRHL